MTFAAWHDLKKKGLNDAERMITLKDSTSSMIFYRTSAERDLLIKESSSVIMMSDQVAVNMFRYV